MKAPTTRLLLVMSLAALASGCVLAPVGPHYRGQPYPQQQPPAEAPPEGPVVYVPPPSPQYEVVGVAPAVGMVWIAGYWFWSGGRHVWRAGYWDYGRPGYRWVPHAWFQARGGWVHRPGYWHRG